MGIGKIITIPIEKESIKTKLPLISTAITGSFFLANIPTYKECQEFLKNLCHYYKSEKVDLTKINKNIEGFSEDIFEYISIIMSDFDKGFIGDEEY